MYLPPPLPIYKGMNTHGRLLCLLVIETLLPAFCPGHQHFTFPMRACGMLFVLGWATGCQADRASLHPHLLQTRWWAGHRQDGTGGTGQMAGGDRQVRAMPRTAFCVPAASRHETLNTRADLFFCTRRLCATFPNGWTYIILSTTTTQYFCWAGVYSCPSVHFRLSGVMPPYFGVCHGAFAHRHDPTLNNKPPSGVQHVCVASPYILPFSPWPSCNPTDKT